MADNKIYQKSRNTSLVLQTLRSNSDGISRIEISRRLSLDRSTITHIVSRLIKQGIIKTITEGDSMPKGGRRPQLLGIEPNFGCILGLEIQYSEYRAVVMDMNGGILSSHSDGFDHSGVSLIDRFKNIVLGMKDDVRATHTPLLGIGLGIPGHVNTENGVILRSKPHEVENFEFCKKVSAFLDTPVLIDNDANCCSWGALEKMKEHTIKNFLYLIMEFHGENGHSLADQEIGIGIVINGHVYYGSDYAAGEILENLFDKDDPVYTYIYSEKNNTKDNDIFRKYIHQLFQKLSVVISVLNPSHLFLGGEFANHKEIVKDVLINEDIRLGRCDFRFSDVGEYETAYGAASMFLEKLFMTPGIKGDHGRASIDWDEICELRKLKTDNVTEKIKI